MSERLLHHGASSLSPTTVTHTTRRTQTPTLRIYPKPPTTASSSLGLLHFLPPLLSPSLNSPSSLLTTHPTGIPPQPTHAACFPIPHSTLVVAKTPREEVTNRSRVSQDPANPSWYKIALRGSQPGPKRSTKKRKKKKKKKKMIRNVVDACDFLLNCFSKEESKRCLLDRN